MLIKFSWGSGWMEVDADRIITNMTIRRYRQWAKLFAKYGTAEQHSAFLQLVTQYIRTQEAECIGIENELIERQGKLYGTIPTVMTSEYWEKQVKLYKGKLNGANAILKKYKTMYEVLS